MYSVTSVKERQGRSLACISHHVQFINAPTSCTRSNSSVTFSQLAPRLRLRLPPLFLLGTGGTVLTLALAGDVRARC